MKKYLVVASFIVGLASCFLPLWAQEAPEQAAPTEAAIEPSAAIEEETEFSYGTVKSVTADQLVVSEYDYESDKDVDVTYSVPADVKLEGASSLKDIAVGDAVDIDFMIKGDQKVASMITIEKPTPEDEEPVDLTADEESAE